MPQGVYERVEGKTYGCMFSKGRPYQYAYYNLERNSKRKGHELALTYDDYLLLVEPDICHYCNGSLGIGPHRRKTTGGKEYNWGYKVDRKDNNLGYLKGNCVACCWECNNMRGDRYSYEEMMMLAPILKEIRLKRIAKC